MSWSRAGALALAVTICATPASAQGIPGTRAHVEGRKGWQAIRDGRHQDAAGESGLARVQAHQSVRDDLQVLGVDVGLRELGCSLDR